MIKNIGILIICVFVAACASQPRPSPETLTKGIGSRQERISILGKECEKEVSYGHLQMCPPHQTCVKDRTHVNETRSACSELALAVTAGTGDVESAYGRCISEASEGKSRAQKAKQVHVTRQKALCEALYNERKRQL